MNEASAWHTDFLLNGNSGNFFWDRSATHNAELICDGSDPNHCKVPYALDLNSLANLGMNTNDILNEVTLAQNTVNSMGVDMGVQFSAATALRDNIIIGEDMSAGTPAFYTGWRQCHGGATINGVCIGGTLDDHLGQITLKVNTNGNFFNFATSEVCPINEPTIVIIYL